MGEEGGDDVIGVANILLLEFRSSLFSSSSVLLEFGGEGGGGFSCVFVRCDIVVWYI